MISTGSGNDIKSLSRLSIKKECPFSLLLFVIALDVPANKIQKGKQVTGIKFKKENTG